MHRHGRGLLIHRRGRIGRRRRHPDQHFFGAPGADISFETRGVDWGPYAARLHRIVKRNWMIPPAAQIGTKAFDWLDAPVQRYGAAEVPAFPFNDGLEAMVMPSVEGIVARARDLARY